MAKASKNAKLPVLAALTGNGVLSAIKFVGFFITGSGSLLAEAVHSSADTLNQFLLFVGLIRSEKAPDSIFQYGYGAERFVWALMSAVGIFFLGCGVTLYHGVSALIQAEPLKDVPWAIGILLISLILEGSVLIVAIRSIKKSAGDRPFFKYLAKEAEPGVVAVISEDSAACFGVLLALVCIGLSYVTGNPIWDSIGSIFIALLMGALAIWLIFRNHGALLGPSMPDDVTKQVMDILNRNPAVEKIVDFKSRVLDSETYRIKADIRFDGRYLAKKLEKKLQYHYPKVHTYEQFKNFAVEYADEVIELLGDEIDEIEEKIQKDVPQAQFLDIEAD